MSRVARSRAPEKLERVYASHERGVYASHERGPMSRVARSRAPEKLAVCPSIDGSC